MLSPVAADGTLTFAVELVNETGHKFPTGYPARRAWLHVTVRDAQARVVFESGAIRPDGSIVGNGADAEPSSFEPHYDVVSTPDQVPIYETVLGNRGGAPTTGLLTATQYLKDNRLLPRGFAKETASSDIAVHGGATTDSDFVGGGDRVHYRVPVLDGGPYAIAVELLYQPIAYRWAPQPRGRAGRRARTIHRLLQCGSTPLIRGGVFGLRHNSTVTDSGSAPLNRSPMPSIELAQFHPIVVHFTIALALMGILFRWLSLLGKPAFLGPAAATLIILAAGASVISSESGEQAYGPVERVPGARAAVIEHEEWGERAEYALLLLGGIELIGLALYKWSKVKTVRVVAAVVGIGAAFCVYEAGEHGGELVYSYAGGVGIRTGDPKDVGRLLLAGYYHQSVADRKAGRHAEAAALISDAAKRFPSDPHVQLLAAESLLVDQRNVRGALEAAAAVTLEDTNRPLRVLRATVQADAHEAAGEPNQAIAALEEANRAFPNPRLQERIDTLKNASR